MSLKAGRVGVNPADVDPINGHINPSSLEGYTKEEADAKFETQEAAVALQPKILEVPISMLSGSKLTVESALQGLQSDKIDNSLSESAVTDIISGASVYTDGMGNHLYKCGKVVEICLSLSSLTAGAFSTVFKIPNGFRPKQNISLLDRENNGWSIKSNGVVENRTALSNAGTNIHATWITN